MDSIARIHHHPNQNLLFLSINHPPSFSKPISYSLSFKSLTKSKTLTKPLKSSFLPLPSTQSPKPQNPSFEILKPLSSFLKTTSITLLAATLFLSRFSKPSIAAPISQPTVESTQEDDTIDSDEEKERIFEEYVDSHPEDPKGLKALMEAKMKARKYKEAIELVDRLVHLEPFEKEWPLLKSHFLTYSGDVESAKMGFEEIISKNPFQVEAYHGLVMAAWQSVSESEELIKVMERIENAMEKCKKEKKKEELRDFQLLYAQVKVVEGNYTDALKIYQQLVKEEPRDFRPHLCLGMIYTLLKKKDEADKHFQKYHRLVPKEHPYARYFEDNMKDTKIFAQMADNAGAKS